MNFVIIYFLITLLNCHKFYVYRKFYNTTELIIILNVAFYQQVLN